MRPLLFFAIIVCTAFSSCTKGKCRKASFSLTAIGFKEAETDTIILRRFEKSTNFSLLHDSLFLDKTNTTFSFFSDTTHVSYRMPDGSGLLSDDFDYQVILPQPNSFFRLTDINYQNLYMGSGEKVVCVNMLTSYKMDGLVHTVSMDFGRIVVTR